MKWFKKVAPSVSALVVVCMLSSCAQTKDGRKTQAQGTAIGAVLGAGLLAGGGALLGVRGDGLVRLAAVGGAIGAGHGFAYGTNVAQMKARYARHEQWLDACIASAQKRNEQAYAFNQSLESKLANLESRAKSARMAGDQRELNSIRKAAVQLQNEANTVQQGLDKEIAAQQTVLKDGDARSSGNFGALQTEVASLKETRGQLGRSMGRIASLSNQSDT